MYNNGMPNSLEDRPEQPNEPNEPQVSPVRDDDDKVISLIGKLWDYHTPEKRAQIRTDLIDEIDPEHPDLILNQELDKSLRRFEKIQAIEGTQRILDLQVGSALEFRRPLLHRIASGVKVQVLKLVRGRR